MHRLPNNKSILTTLDILTELLVVPRQAEAVPDITPATPLERGLEPLLADVNLLDPRPDALVGGEPQHLEGLLARAEVRRPDQAPVLDLRPRRHLGALVLLGRHADADPAAVHVQQRQEGRAVDARAGAVEDQVEGVLVLVPRALVAHDDDPRRAQLPRVRVQAVVQHEGPHLLGAHGLGEHDGQVAQPADADDADLGAGPAAVSLERRVDRQARAHHGRGDGGGELLGHREAVVLVDADVRRVAALGHVARVGPHRAVRVELVRAVLLVALLALPALEAGPGRGAHADAVAYLVEGYFWSDAGYEADDFCRGTH